MARCDRMGVVLCVLAGACGGPAEPSGPWALSRALIDGGRVEVVVPDGEADRVARLAGAELEERGRFQVSFVRPGAASSSRGAVARYWIGTPGTVGAEEALSRLGLEALETGGGFRFLGKEYTASEDALCATLEDPRRAGRTLTVLLGNDAGRAARLFFGSEPTWRTGFRTWRGGWVEREGPLRADGRVREGGVLAFEEARARVFEPRRTVAVGALELVLPNGLEAPEAAWAQRAERARVRVAELFGEDPAAGQPLRVFLYTSVEDKARLTRDWALGSVDRVTGAVHAVHATGLDDGGFALARAQALAFRGPPRAAWLEDGVAAAAIKAWWGRPMDEWLAHLHAGGATPELAELIALEPGRSPHLIAPMRGALVRHLVEARGPGEVRALWSGARKLGADDAALRASFRGWLDGLVERHGAQVAAARAARLAAGTSTALRKGVNLCAESAGADPLVDGLGTRACDDSLRRASEIGANAVALVVDAWVEPPAPRPGAERRAEPRSATASDAALAQSARRAGELGLRVMLRPRLAYAPASNWAGVMMMTTRERQERFFALYADFVEHYALLAELLPACEILCIGGEMSEATATVVREGWQRDAPFFELRRAGWSSVIARARAAFGGGLTYAAHWGNEANTLEFWPALDFVGKNLFSTLAMPGSDRPPNEKEIGGLLTWSLHQLGELGKLHGRPALVTEIGCSSSADAWRDPASILGPVDLDLQRRFFVGLEAALWRQQREPNPLAGVYIWCWSSDPRVGGSRDRHFSPQNKPAEGVLRALFRRS